MIVRLLDSGAGNLHSVARALAAYPGADVRITGSAAQLLDGDLVVLPGVGAFPGAAACLASARRALRDALAAGQPCIGLCLGMQLLFESSDEGPGAGLGLIPGRVTPLRAQRVPHIGWNTLERRTGAGGMELACAWFANGFACRPGDESVVRAWTRHDADRFPAVVRTARTIGVQFHPEKSGRAGVAWLHACMREVLCA